MAGEKDYTFKNFGLAVSVIGLLLLLGLVPPFKVFGMRVKQIDILSDLFPKSETALNGEALEMYSDTAFMAESLLAAEALKEAPSTTTGLSQSWDVSPRGIVASPSHATPAMGVEEAGPDDWHASGGGNASVDPDGFADPATPIEDFSPEAKDMAVFYKALSEGYPDRPVRIAVLGDSFIEADIITADLREQLQDAFGGRGAGFVPFASPLAKYRATVKHSFDGWQTYNVVKKKTAPENVRDRFFVSGLACIPSEGAWTKVEGTDFRKNLMRCNVARILFTNTASSVIHVTVNDSIKSQFTPTASPHVQQIILNGDIRSIEVKITSAEGFTGYGIVLEDRHGVTVDNYSIRGNSGMALFGTNAGINSQIGQLLGYDLVILQYGLNAMSPGILNYNPYTAQMVRIAGYVRECFPGAAVMVMSVGDRGTLDQGEYVTMPAAKAMLAAQKKAAEQSATAFWNTFEAMGGEKSMVKFVQNKWASKDYTHIGYPGGKQIATEMVRSLVQGFGGYGDAQPIDTVPDLPLLTPENSALIPQTVPALVPGDVLPAPSAALPADTAVTRKRARVRPEAETEQTPTPAADSLQTTPDR